MNSRPLATTDTPRWWLPALVVLLLAAGWLFSTIRTGHAWGDDFAMYIHHAANLAQHRAYADTGYLYNVRMAEYGPRVYPPGFPLLLAPVYALAGMSFHAMKVEETLFFVLTLALVAWLFRRELGPWSLAGLVALLGFSPYFWDFKDNVTSDLPFLFWFYLVALIVSRAPQRSLLWGLSAGVGLYFCYATRSVGIVLVGAIVLQDLLQSRRVHRFSLTAAAAATVLIVVQQQWAGSSERSYVDQLHPTVGLVAGNLSFYVSQLRTLWAPAEALALSYVLFGLVTGLAAFGFWLRSRQEWRPIDTLSACLVVPVLLWGSVSGLRMVQPLVPLYLACALVALQAIARRLPPRWRYAPLAGLLLLAAADYTQYYRAHSLTALSEGIAQPDFQALCQFLRQTAPPADGVVFYRARALSLFTGHPATIYTIPPDAADDWADWRRLGIRYVVRSSVFEQDREVLDPLLAQHRAELTPVYENSEFRVYRVDWPPPAAAAVVR